MATGKLYLNLNEEWIEENKAEGFKEHIKVVGEKEHEENPEMIFDFPNISVEEVYVTSDDKLFVSFDKGYGMYFSVEVPMETLDIKVIEYCVKRMNKIKTVIEGLK